MLKIRKNDIVARKSYGCDILFSVDKIISSTNGTAIAILKGITVRIIADAYLDDLLFIDKDLIDVNIKNLDSKIEDRIFDTSLLKTRYRINNNNLKWVESLTEDNFEMN